MKTAASIFKIQVNGSAEDSNVSSREQKMEMPARKNEDLQRSWSLEALPPPGMVLTRPLKKNGLFGGGSSIEGSWQVLAAQTLKIASINGLGDLHQLENDLEDEISFDNRSPAKTALGRWRREGHHQLHSKVVLFVVVLLNIIDTVFVMVGLILDFHHVSQLLDAKMEMLNSFADNLSTKYKIEASDQRVLQNLLNAHIIFNTSSLAGNITELAAECLQFVNNTAASYNQSMDSFIKSLSYEDAYNNEPNMCFRAYVSTDEPYILTNTGEIDATLTTVAHKLHYCSLSILAVLVVILLLKLFCSGTRFFKDHMQVFDGLITIISFVLDIVFMNGVTFFNQEQFVVILTLLFPWRVIRILNSLIAAVLDKHRLNLKILYTQKKRIARTLSETNAKLEDLQKQLERLQNLCSSRGIGDYEVIKALRGDAAGSSQKNGAAGGLAGMMALGKLAFQAADAFAPMTDGYKNEKSDGSSPAGNSQASDTTDTTLASENNNGVTVIENTDHKEKSITYIHSDSYNETFPRPSIDEVVTVHINGFGLRRDRGLTFKRRISNKVSISMPDLTDDNHNDENDCVSRL